jgi:hypothetical protein
MGRALPQNLLDRAWPAVSVACIHGFRNDSLKLAQF